MMEQIMDVLVRGVPKYAGTLISVFRVPNAEADSTRYTVCTYRSTHIVMWHVAYE
jgi:hypothetical protein